MFIPQNKKNRNESETRAELIDPKLADDGWKPSNEIEILREPITKETRHSKALKPDYVLVYKGEKVAAVEAKRERLSYTEGVRQAKDYATRLQCRFAYATNGHEIYQIDMLTNEEKLVERYLSPQEAWDCIDKEKNASAPYYQPIWQERFRNIPFERKGDWQPRYYQENAINNTLEAIAQARQRILLTLATGTGKTCIAFQIAWTLYKARWSLKAQKSPDDAKRIPRILFLADRNILADQALNNFGPFGEDAIVRLEPSEIRKKGSVPKNASIFFAIFQTLMSGPNTKIAEEEQDNILPDKQAFFKQYARDFFDFVIIDECHRGGANDESNWRGILEHFAPAVQLGLTATPKRQNNGDTYQYFGEPVYTYTLKDGISDGFLTPFKVCPISGTMDEYTYTPGDGVIIEGKEPEPGRKYKEQDFNRSITIPEREKMRVQYWMNQINPHHKTIVFCASQEHAGMVRDFVNQYAQQKKWTTNINYCVRVTANDGKDGEIDLRTFQDNEKTIPTILTTSRKLSTGVDARNLRNIVLMRPCNNMIEFKQIIGRGTRVYEGKDFFTIYDFVKAHHNFADPEWDGEPLPPEKICTTCGDNPCSCTKEPCDTCGFAPCSCAQEPEPPCKICKSSPCACEPDVCTTCDESPCVCQKENKVVIKLKDGKVREIHQVSSMLYLTPEGDLVTAKELLEYLYDYLPRFFHNEEELRKIWSIPDTREKLLERLQHDGYDSEKLAVMQNLIGANDSDVYDVLHYIAYSGETISRKERVTSARLEIEKQFKDDKQLQFIYFVLDQYIEIGFEELSTKKMPELIELKYGTIEDAKKELGSVKSIRKTFIDFQKYLYR